MNTIINKFRRMLGIILLITLVLQEVYYWADVPTIIYFTVISNAFYMVILIFHERLSRYKHFIKIKGYVCVYMVITGFVFTGFMNDVFVSGSYTSILVGMTHPYNHYITLIASFVTHTIFPLICLVDFIYLTKSVKVFIKDYYKMIIYPVLYAFYHMILQTEFGYIAYPFLDPNQTKKWMIILSILLMVIVFIGTYKVLLRFQTNIEKKYLLSE